MAQPISIGSAKYPDAIRHCLGTEFKHLQKQGIKVNIWHNELGEFTFLGCDIDDTGPKETLSINKVSIFRHYIARAVADLILNQWEGSLVSRIIRNNYNYLNEEERRQIYHRVLQYLKQADQEEVFYRFDRKSKILNKVLEYLEGNDKLIVEGFINFRLKDYLLELEQVVDQTVDEYLMEKEYKEFIRLLKYFVDVQENRVDKVHVVLKPSGVFQIYDGEENMIKNECIEGVVVDLVESEINYEDLLISALITIAPGKIVLHGNGHEKLKNTVETIENVFGEKVQHCPGCSRCRHLNR
ncbi:putative sporulation protein YtxC [Calderihabitans maritimus]|uniref:Sporulation protein YtxC n=1 Tax=Calderihabitans maritimus TaxID=1246530 RepID=A0A1Z5HRP7_9FIRM|nr:putative sporulation protein YtxC [Calderihabitans maritimus]GAW92037.1 sporulation protein YtxC [Calderihabitans maritimus]